MVGWLLPRIALRTLRSSKVELRRLTTTTLSLGGRVREGFIDEQQLEEMAAIAVNH